MKMNLIIAFGILGIFSSQLCLASDEKEREYLLQIVNQLEAIKPQIIAAEKQQPIGNRIKFHYMRYRDSKGELKNGLLEDVNSIEQGVKERINKTPSSPHLIEPLSGDYIQHQKDNTV